MGADGADAQGRGRAQSAGTLILVLLTDRSVIILPGMRQRRSKRQDIIEAAVALLGSEGFEGFSASALAEAAGVSKANLFHHFSGLDEVVIEAFDQYAMQMELVSPSGSVAFNDWLSRAGQSVIRGEEMAPELVRAYFVFVGRALFDARLRKKVLSTSDDAHTVLSEIVREAYPGPLNVREIDDMARLVLVTLDGFAIHAHAFPERQEALLAAWALFVRQLMPEDV